MKYVLLVGDGMADEPLEKLGGKTPLEVANIPYLNQLAALGQLGLVQNVPEGIKPGSDVACLSVLGYNPAKVYTGRGPLEAASQGIELAKDDVAYRFNFVTIRDEKMADFSAGHITTEEAHALTRTLNEKLGSPDYKFYPGVSYRNLFIWHKGSDLPKCTPPHDITGQSIAQYLPQGSASELLNKLMSASREILTVHQVNQKRKEQGLNTADSIWIWGGGDRPSLKTFAERFHLTGSVITAVDLIKGLGNLMGLDVINVPGATGYFDTNYQGKGKYALRSLRVKDFVFVHCEPPDEAGHEGNLEEKIKAIENFDKFIVGQIWEGLKKSGQDFRMLVLPDHPTPIAKKTHTGDPVPFVIFDSRKAGTTTGQKFNEKAAGQSGTFIKKGHDLIRILLEK